MQNPLPKGNTVPKDLELENIEQLLAEADDLIQRINSAISYRTIGIRK